MTLAGAPPVLLASCWTIGGNICPGTADNVSALRLEDRIEAAAAAGYTGIGLWHGDLQHALQRLSYADINDCLVRNGISTIELEYLADWFAYGEARVQADQIRNDLFAAARALKPRHIKIVPPFGNAQYAMSHLAAEFSTLCGQAAQHGLLVALEMIPFSDIATLQAAQNLVTRAACTNGGILVDIWHLYRSGGSCAELARVPKQFLMAAELCDADEVPQGSLATDSMHHRKFCGDGVFDIPQFIATMEKAGYQGPYGIEILSDDLRKLPLQTAATESYHTTRAMWGSKSL